MSGQYGHDQIKKVALFGLSFGESLTHAMSSATTLGKAAAFLTCLDEAADLLTIDRQQLADEWAEFDANDREALFLDVAAEFDLADDALEARIEGCITAGLKILEGIEGAMAAWKGIAG